MKNFNNQVKVKIYNNERYRKNKFRKKNCIFF
jgi:hypothetical protein